MPSFATLLKQEEVLHQIYWPGRGRLLDNAADILEDILAGQRLLLVLEDYHYVADSEEVREVLDSMLRLFPTQVHFIIISRNRIRLSALPGLAAAGQAVELGQEKLRFTLAEAEQLFAGQPGLVLSRESVEQTWRELAGWPMGMQLAGQALASGAGPDNFIGVFGQGNGRLYLFEEIMEEILTGEPPDICEVLLKTAVFKEWDGELFNGVFARRDGAALVDYLAGRGLPVERVAGGLRYHKLFKDYLLNRLKEDGQGYRDVQNLVAGYFLTRERPEDAFLYLVAAGDFGRAALVLQQAAPLLIRQGRLVTLGAWLGAMPRRVADAFPEIILDFGEACVRAYKYREGLVWLRRAAGAFGRMGDAAGLTRSLCVQGSAFTARGEHGNARAVYRQALGEIGSADSRLRGTMLQYMAVWAARMGEAERARQLFDEAAAQYRAAGEAALEAEVLLDQASFYCYRRGFFHEAMGLVGRSAVAAEISGDLALKARCRLLAGTVFLRLGNPGEALKKFQSARQLYTGEERASLTVVLARLGEAEALCLQAAPDYQQAELLYRRAADELGRVEPSLEAEFLLALGQSTVYRYRGETVRALEEAHNALEMARGMNDSWLEAVGRINLAAAGILAGGESLAAGLEFLEEGAVAFAAWDDGYHLALVDLWRLFGNFCLTGEAERTLLNKCLLHFEQFPPLLILEKELSRFVLKHTRVSGTKATQGVEKMDSPTSSCILEPVIEPLAADAPRLRICCLGAFQVYRGGELLDERHWSRRKGKTMLKFLALYIGQKVPKDVIVDLLWPDLPPEKAANAFYVTLHALRKMLNAGVNREIEYVAVRDGMIYLEPRLVEEVDVEAFNRACALAFSERAAVPDMAAAHLKEARRFYRGDLLAEDAYAIWPASAREKLRQQYLKVLAALAENAAGAGRLAEALELWREVVDRDPLHETAQLETIRLLALQGRPAAARQQFLGYRRILKKEIGSDPGEEIMQLYRQILKNQGGP